MFKSIAKIIIFTLGYRVLGFMRDIIIANNFGNGSETDALFLAQSIPNLLIEIFAVGAFSSAIVPIILEKKIKINEIYGNFILFFSFISIIGFIFSDKVVLFLAPGFKEQEIYMTSKMAKVFIATIPIMIFNELNSAIIISKNKSEKITFSNLINNFALIIVSLVLLKFVKITAFVYGSVIGLLFKSIYLLNKNKNEVKISKIKLNFKNQDFYKIIFLMIPIIVSSIGMQINFIIDRNIASRLEIGAISTLNYANKIIQLPLGIILGAVVLSSFPLVIKSIQNENQDEYENLIKEKIEIILITMLFLSNFIFIYSKEIVSIIYGRGNFIESDILKTSEVVKYYIYSIIGIGFTTIFQKIFHAYKRTKLPAIISCIGVVLNIVLNIVLSKILGVKGLALATTLSSFSIFIIMLMILKIEKNIYYNFQKILYIICLNIFLFIFNKLFLQKIVISNEIFSITLFGIINTIVYSIFLLKIYSINIKKLKRR